MRQPEDLALMTVARRRRWRQCTRCNHMIELGEGCHHITCKCSFEFCYVCGAPWEKVPGQRSRQTCESNRTTCMSWCRLHQDCCHSRRAPTSPAAGKCELFDTTPVRDDPEPVQEDPEPAGLPHWVPLYVRPVYKTELCMYFPTGTCQRGARCWFAHDADEVREPYFLGSVPRGAADTDSD